MRYIALILLALGLSSCKTVPTVTAQEVTKEKMLKGMRVALLATDGFEQVELTEPKKALEAAGAEVVVISPKAGKIQGYKHDKPANLVKVDLPLDKAHPDNFHALLLPGGVKNPDALRLVPEAITFIQEMGAAHKPIAAICHGPWPLINAGLVKNHKVTSWPSLEVDLKNAGAHWVDEEVVISDNLVTSRKPQDIPAFNNAMIEVFTRAKK
jgi:protease I